jgi:vacuolar-type H+-ATPase subunit E/Vma4
MDLSAYEAFLLRYLTETPLTGGETLRVPAAYAHIDMAALNDKLAEKGKPALVLDTNHPVKNGFRLVKGAIENDNSFEALIDYYRETLEQSVVEALFDV